MDNTAVIEINGKNYVMTFGLGFLRELNANYTLTANGIEVRNGIAQALIDISSNNAAIFYDMILFATRNLTKKPAPHEIENYVLERMNTVEELDEMSAFFLDCLKKVPGWTAFEQRMNLNSEEAENKIPEA